MGGAASLLFPRRGGSDSPQRELGGFGKNMFASMKTLTRGQPKEKPDPLRTAAEVIVNEEALNRVKNALEFAPPGTVFRWDKLLTAVNRAVPSTDPNKPPLELALDMEQLRLTLSMVYQNIKSINSDGIVLMRDNIPKMYEKHSVERGRRVSQKEREEKNMSDECYSYGELDYEIFSTIYSKVSSAYGVFPNGCFYDLGSGVGTLVFVAAMIGSFSKCAGVENIFALHERAELRLVRWNKLKEGLPRRYREIEIEFSHDNFFECNYQSEATFVFLHWTAFSRNQREVVANLLELCREGTICISVTHPIPGETFDILQEDTCDTSWGRATFYVQEKMTPARNKR